MMYTVEGDMPIGIQEVAHLNIDRLRKLAIGQALGGSVMALPWIAELVENERLMIEARVITGKSEEDIRAAVAQSPLSFRDFVQLLKLGIWL